MILEITIGLILIDCVKLVITYYLCLPVCIFNTAHKQCNVYAIIWGLSSTSTLYKLSDKIHK